jgi:hypothetical protein
MIQFKMLMGRNWSPWRPTMADFSSILVNHFKTPRDSNKQGKSFDFLVQKLATRAAKALQK